jgi:hypothetical protein
VDEGNIAAVDATVEDDTCISWGSDPEVTVGVKHIAKVLCWKNVENRAHKTSKATERLVSSTLAILYAGLPGICPGQIADTTSDQRSESAHTVNLLLCYKNPYIHKCESLNKL